MNSVDQIISQLVESSLHPARTVKAAMESSGKKAVGCFPLYTPDEIVYAAGLLPVGLWGGQADIKLADKYLQSFCCSVMRANMEQGMKGAYDFLSALIIPTFCDTLKCVCANWPYAVPNTPLIPMVYPQNRKSSAGLAYLMEELKRVQGELEALSGRKISEDSLTESLSVYDDYRETMDRFTQMAAQFPRTINVKTRHQIIKAAYFMDKRVYTALVKELMAGLAKLPDEPAPGLKVVATGIMVDSEALLDTLVQNGITFVADNLAQESRQFRTRTRREGSGLERLACRMADQRGCSLLFDQAKEHGSLLIDLARKNQAQAIAVFMMKFCDPEEFDYPILKAEIEAAGIPLLYLEIEQKMNSVEGIRTRIQSFSEMFL